MIFEKLNFWWNCSRAFALPVTVMSWLVVFIYALISGGNALYGVIALFGVCFAHLAANIFDDYFDYKILSKDEKYLKSAQICKCKFITDGLVTHKGMLIAGLVCLFAAVCFGAVLTYLTGWGAVIIALLASVFVIFYSIFTFAGLGELAVGITYGPLLFEDSLKMLGKFYALGYIFIILFSYLTQLYWCSISLLALPLIILLYKSLKVYNFDKTLVPEVKWWNYPLGNWEHIEKEGTQSFYLRLYLARNITTYFTVLVCIAFALEKFL